MNKKVMKRLVVLLSIVIMTFGSTVPVLAAKTFEDIGNVTPSKEAYRVDIQEGFNNFLRNDKPVDLSVGKRYYMTYTVDTVTKNELKQNGMCITKNIDKEYIYTEGMMQYSFGPDLLFEEGYTYFYRIEVTEEGFDYIIAKVSDKESKWLEFSHKVAGDNKDCSHFGIWLGGTPEARVSMNLTQVLCYDEAGNDLGVGIQGLGALTVYQTKGMDGKKVDHYYEFSLENATYVAISNERPTDSKVIYMSYKVENLKMNTANQAGIVYSNSPKSQYPHASGLLNYAFCQGSPLLREGAEYLIRMEVLEDTIKVLVKETYQGKESYFAMPLYHGEMKQGSQYMTWWFGDGTDAKLTADFKEFRCYDDKGRNLSVQFNDFNKNVIVTHFGNLEDYTYCEAVYYCRGNDTLIILDDECNAGVLVDQEGQETQWGNYSVRGTALTMNIGKQEEVYEYLYEYMTDTQDNRYVRLGKKKVQLVTGGKEDTENQIIEVTADSGYKLVKPENPVLKGYTFDAWCTLDGTEYDFDNIVTESFTLYARYTDGNGHEYLMVDNQNVNNQLSKIVVIVTSSILLVGATIVGSVLILKKGKQKNAE